MTATAVAVPVFDPASLIKTTQLLEKLVAYVPQYGSYLALLPGVGPYIAIAISAEPLAEAVLKLIEEVEASSAGGFNIMGVFSAIESHFPEIAAAAKQAKITLPTLPFPFPSPVVPAGAGVTSAEQAGINFQANSGG